MVDHNVVSDAARRTWYTLAELSMASGYAEPTIRRWVRAGRIPYLHPGGKGGHLRFPTDALAVIEARHIQSSAGAESVPPAAMPAKLPGRRPKFLD